MLSNVRSLENKLDVIQPSRSTEHEAKDCCVFVFTETWLNDKIPNSSVQLHWLTCCRADRDSSLSGKTRGGGLCVYINKEWCNNSAVVTKHCSSLVEFMFVKCRPFYLPREFTANHLNLKSVLPKFYQHVNFATRGNNTLDFVYTTNKNAYRAEPAPTSDTQTTSLLCYLLCYLSHGIKKAKHQCAQKINNNFSDSKDTRSLWQAIQTITDYKPLPQASDDDTSLPDALNHFYS
ncbi:hypothetical protein M9458_054235 [Cirrhinus mrigala]|uniref:Uncharacterized protein n=1 Tax=Cirrhinus mrigala TaxID=683832 RepID=A0ABD0MMS6_CIRMR